MIKWRQNEGDFRIKGFALLQKSPSFHPHPVILRHSWMMKLVGMEWKWMECLMNEVPPFFIFIPWHSRMMRNDGMRRNESDFGTEQKNWILRCLSFCHHSVIWSSFRNGIIPHNLSVKSIHPSPSAEGDGRIDSTLPFLFPSLTHSFHSLLIPSFLDHSSHYRREVNPAIHLCRGGWADRLHASFWMPIPDSFLTFPSHSFIPWSFISL